MLFCIEDDHDLSQNLTCPEMTAIGTEIENRALMISNIPVIHNHTIVRMLDIHFEELTYQY